ncbi:hypothetical protein J1N35_009930 [Gossypium stocksii]|uniref:Uncharacterized protein n=1 Tax=Gossypium stocksii TaxID=47602 RepID=A0A9D3W010_9ROSI|nr:hypothetical protein J1N35_009930 [Gossypium stocksii]
MVTVLAVLSIEDGEFDVWHIDSGCCHWINEWIRAGCYHIGAERGQIRGEEMVMDLAKVEVSHHSFVTEDVWYQESFVRINVKMSVCTRGSSNNS